MAVYVRSKKKRLPRLCIQQQFDSFVRCSSGKGRLTCQQLVKYCAEPIDICGAADSRVVSHCLLWRHVTWRAQNFQRARHRALRFDKSRKTEVGEMRFALLVQQNVSRLDVAMQNPVLMRVVNGACHFGDEFSRLPDRHW